MDNTVAQFPSGGLVDVDIPMRTWYPIVKRTFDVLVAVLFFLLFLPLFTIIALVIVLDSPGSPVFRQMRIGAHGEPFQMLKFRTMIPDRRKRQAGPPPGVAERRRVHKSPFDPRVTRVGRILRRTCLDELPQLINVLNGDMSLVGPRPELPSIVKHYESWQHLRHVTRPGITGWWQVNRDHRLMHQATELDVYYVQHQSFWLDMLILARTFGVVARGEGTF